MITLPNADGVIWDKEYHVLEITKEMITNGTCEINLNSEGPCAKSLGLYDLLDHICALFSFEKKCIKIVTCNQLESHPEYKIKINPPLYIAETQDFYRINAGKFNEKCFPDIKPVAMFIGRSNFLRLQLASEISQRYQNHVEITFHYDRTLEFHIPNCGLEDLINRNFDWTTIADSLNFLSQCPKKFLEEKVVYPILTPNHLDICRYYHSFFCEIVCETYSKGNSFYPTEKIWRPLLMKTPFIVQGSMYYLDNLKKLGFKTFDRWWDEGHQHDPYDFQPNAILKIIKQIMMLSSNELKQMYDEMKPTLQYNHDRFMELHNNEFVDIFDYK